MRSATPGKFIALSLILSPLLFLTACAQNPDQVAKAATGNTLSAISAAQQAQQNKAIVIDFYEGIFLKHKVQEYADRYISNTYTQHNPSVPDGKNAVIEYFTTYFKENPDATTSIKRVIAQGDLVVLHVHSTRNKQDRGAAIMDIFRVKNGKIVELWDVIQPIPEQSANNNTMF
ncbi:nuclear transport factor 2 family protein [Acinetobacter sp. WZC-1]|uniref:nuclear transport factor 2 family protein n=1 Tax=Acinetobacter sp. WZC-1 TaxID=3459034 RepID=UPI00403D69E4